MTYAEVVSRLPDARPCRDGVLARCPAHNDHSPSLSVLPRLGRPPWLRCFAGCAREAIVAALGFPPEAQDRPMDMRPAESREEAMRREILAAVRRQPWTRHDTRLLYAASDLYRQTGETIRHLHHVAQTLPPDLDATWELLSQAARLEDQQRALGEALDRWR